ncbi:MULTISPECIES: hypothetical protein [Amycolatopsis]|uniref:Spore-associated protein A n=1 Tax=Amycolatopsis bullii TaxID=941987 RepID=A0ABQ3K748_9PSEU|nr:hypothetical protein [Amycolatopsis bullii]GHG03034.1 hypothetical protein GCM10017567_18060 [Amycolatopsis bullii]
MSTRIRTVLAGALLSAAAVVTTALPAAAATNPYTPAEVCGSGYRVISSKPAKTDAGREYGGVYLLYKSGGYNCVVTIKWTSIGVATDTMAGLYRDSEDTSRNLIDQGNFKYYAVVRGYAPDCVMYAGWVGDAVATSGWGWCG